MPETSERQQPSPVEQGNIHLGAKEFLHKTVQSPSSEPRPETSLHKLESGDLVGYMDEENKKYFRENAETPEIALPIRPINFQLSVFQAARREQRLSLAIGGCPSVTLTRV